MGCRLAPVCDPPTNPRKQTGIWLRLGIPRQGPRTRHPVETAVLLTSAGVDAVHITRTLSQGP